MRHASTLRAASQPAGGGFPARDGIEERVALLCLARLREWHPAVKDAGDERGRQVLHRRQRLARGSGRGAVVGLRCSGEARVLTGHEGVTVH